MKLDPELKAKWVAALRSGNYTQGLGCLRGQGNKFCCLGVLCDVIEPNDWVGSPNGNYMFRGHIGAYGNDLMDIRVIDRLTSMNDWDKKNFNEIADYIEEVL